MQPNTLPSILISVWENLKDSYTQLVNPAPTIPLHLTVPSAFRALFTSYGDHIHQRELLFDPEQDLYRALSLWGYTRERRFLQIIAKMERLICTLQPPASDAAYSKQTLREKIRQDTDVPSLGEALQLLYLEPRPQQLLIYDFGLRSTIHYLSTTMGGPQLEAYLRSHLEETPLANLCIVQTRLTLNQQDMLTLLRLSSAQLDALSRLLYRVCYERIHTSVGDKVACQLLSDSYGFLHTCYDNEISQQLFAVLPLEITESILVQTLNRHELEAKVTQATKEERERRLVAEQLAQELERKKQELQQEKESISFKVQERTQELAQERDRLDASIGSLPIGFLMTDAHHAVEYINPTARNILNLPTGGAPPTIDQISASLQQKIELPDIISQCETSRLPSVSQTIHLGEKFLTIKVSPIIDTHGERDAPPTIGAVILLEDVTEIKILERSKEEFFAIASHELRTPLTVIRWNVDILQGIVAHLPTLPEQVPHLVSGIADAGTRLLDIINDFLDISRLEQHRTMFRVHPLDIRAAISTIHEDLAPLAQEKRLILTLQAPDDLPQVAADDNRLRQVLVNLISNAIKYTDTGRITTSIGRTEHQIEIRVTDTGQGIPPASKPLLFRKFQMARDNFLTREAARSTGLGLYICKLLVEGMGGTISLEHSVQGQGSTFLFTLPLAPTTPQEQQPKQLSGSALSSSLSPETSLPQH